MLSVGSDWQGKKRWKTSTECRKWLTGEKARENKYGVPEVTGRRKKCRSKFWADIICCWLFFRTVWYEMCSGSWPFKKQIPEAIIWQVGRGLKQSLANVDVPREVKVSSDKLWFWYCTVRETKQFKCIIQTKSCIVAWRIVRLFFATSLQCNNF